jgi:hypothetical protein
MGIVKYVFNTAAEETLDQTIISQKGGKRGIVLYCIVLYCIVLTVDLKTERKTKKALHHSLLEAIQIQLGVELFRRK